MLATEHARAASNLAGRRVAVAVLRYFVAVRPGADTSPVRPQRRHWLSTGVRPTATVGGLGAGRGRLHPPNFKKYAINVSTIGIWKKRGLMDEEFLFWDNQTFNQQIGLA
jgi:hypothetical protein